MSSSVLDQASATTLQIFFAALRQAQQELRVPLDRDSTEGKNILAGIELSTESFNNLGERLVHHTTKLSLVFSKEPSSEVIKPIVLDIHNHVLVIYALLRSILPSAGPTLKAHVFKIGSNLATSLLTLVCKMLELKPGGKIEPHYTGEVWERVKVIQNLSLLNSSAISKKILQSLSLMKDAISEMIEVKENGIVGDAAGQAVNPQLGEHVAIWEWRNDDFEWTKYDNETSSQIETASQNGEETVRLTKGFFRTHPGYQVVLKKRLQQYESTHKQREIRKVQQQIERTELKEEKETVPTDSEFLDDFDEEDIYTPLEMKNVKNSINVMKTCNNIVRHVYMHIAKLSQTKTDEAPDFVTWMETLCQNCQKVIEETDKLGSYIYPPQDFSILTEICKSLLAIVRDGILQESLRNGWFVKHDEWVEESNKKLTKSVTRLLKKIVDPETMKSIVENK